MWNLQAATEIALTKIDCLSGMKDLKICVAYAGDQIEKPDLATNRSTKPCLRRHARSGMSITGSRTFDSLPIAAQHYVECIEALMGVPISMVSVGQIT